MKISRQKKSQKTLNFYSTNFNYREPYQVLIDATFCHAALENRVLIEDQLKTYFQCDIKFVTTQCIILEVEALGSKLTGTAQIVKRFLVHKCGHEGKAIAAAQCIKSMTKTSRYIVASQDRELQNCLRKIPGRCLLYLHKAAPVLDPPSPASKKYVLKKSQNRLSVQMEEHIEKLKKEHGLKKEVDLTQKKHKGPKNPNPLSCKKSKKEKKSVGATPQRGLNDKSKVVMKPKRKRIKIPAHVKEAIQNSNST